jgi:hypothetical protein
MAEAELLAKAAHFHASVELIVVRVVVFFTSTDL